MIVVLQRVEEAYVEIDKLVKSSIKKGLMVLVGITHDDGREDIEWLCQKILNLRIFNDPEGRMNLSLKDIDGEILIVSQFTLHASTKKGARPSYIAAAGAEIAKPLYDEFIKEAEKILGKKAGTGTFGAQMKIGLVNDGPVTIIIDSKDKK